jgi:hypothetical protein
VLFATYNYNDQLKEEKLAGYVARTVTEKNKYIGFLLESEKERDH